MKTLLAALLLLLAAPALAQHQHAGRPAAAAAPAVECAELALSCATATTPAFDAEGRLWLAYSAGGRVMLTSSPDLGRTTTPPVPVSREAAAVDDNGEARPKLVPTRGGGLLVAWTIRRDRAYNGSQLLALSSDGGRSFSAPRRMVVEANPTSQRFESFAQAPDGRIWAVWLDKRRAPAERAAGNPGYTAGLAVAWSDDGGQSFTESRLARDNTCECCRIGLAFDRQAQPVLAWRQIFGRNFRDHAAARLRRDGALEGPFRIAEDNWAIDACPHHGPALAVDGSGRWHSAWYSGGGDHQGLFYAASTDDGRHFATPRRLGNPARQPGHPQLLALGERLLLIWQEFDGEKMRVMAETSADGGANWTAPRELAATADAADQPQLVSNGREAFLSWQTRLEGWRFLPVPLGGGA
jgi:hypothetical protein